MGGTNKNIRSRRAIRKAAPTLPKQFTAVEMAGASGYGIKRVANLMRTMDDFMIDRTKPKGIRRNLWSYKPKET